MEQRKRCRCVAIAECSQSHDLGRLDTKRRRCRHDVIAGSLEAAILAGRITNAAPVIAEHRNAGGREPCGEQGHAAMRADADFIAAGNDQQAGGTRRVVKCAEQRFA